MKILVDSSIIIDHLRVTTKKESVLVSIYRQHEVYFSLISVGEIFSGKSVTGNEKKVRDIFSLGQMVECNRGVMEKAGQIRRETEISLLDAIIAASAIALDLSVATLNRRDFAKVSGLELYKIE